MILNQFSSRQDPMTGRATSALFDGAATGGLLMPWARIDDAFDDHPKVLAVLEHEQGGAAIGLWTLCLTWAHRNTLKRGKTPGLISASLPRRYLGPGARELAALLVKEGLWEPLAEGDGWLIHDFDQYLPAAQTSQARSEAGRKGAASRWGKPAGDDNDSDQHGKLPYPAGTEPATSQDVASGPIANDGSRAHARRVPVVGSTGSNPESRDPSPEDLTAPQKRRRGTRIPGDFSMTPEMAEWGRARCPHVHGRNETEKFINYWRAASGQQATKLDWLATWRNWMLTAEERSPQSSGRHATRGGASDDLADEDYSKGVII
jgi:hypothetical protein